MNTNLVHIVKEIIAANGEGILGDPARVKAFFSDLAKDELKPLRIAFGRGLEAGAYQALKTAPDAAERILRKTALAQRLRDEHGLDPVLCAEALDVLEAALYGEAEPPVLCKSCGKELQKEWKACPYCGTVFEIEAPPEQPPAAAPAVSVQQSASVPATQSHAQIPPRKKSRTLRNVLIVAAVAAAVTAGVIVYQQRPPEGFVKIKGGTFTMGSPANEPERFDLGPRDWEGPQHQVTVSTFSMGKYEVTQREWREVMGNNPSNFRGDNLPVEQVSWSDAVEYCNKRSQREGLTPAYTINWTNVSWNRNADGYRLPTEAEWEYACRAGTRGPFNTGNNITTSEANYDGNYPYNNNAKGVYREKTVEVGSFAANRWGLYDMHGNVWEWCWDWFEDYDYRVLRGGSWVNYAQSVRSAARGSETPTYRGGNVGFRLVCGPTPVQQPAAPSPVAPQSAFVKINGGTFTMGSPANEAKRHADEVQHQVTVSSFYMGKYEVTQKEWRDVMGNNPSNFRGDNLPVEQVSWYEAVEYCNKRSQRDGLTPAYTINKTRRDPQNSNEDEYDELRWLVTWDRNANGYRLPTEAEWEYACRAGTTGSFNTGSNITTSEANYNGDGSYNNNAKGRYRGKTVEAGSFAANGWGLYDMHGNVFEWCWDWYGDYTSRSQSDPVGPSTGADRVERGGSWDYGARLVRSAFRLYFTPSYRFNDLGFRLVRSR